MALKNDIINIVKLVSKEFSMDWRALAAFVEVESSGVGFSANGKILIQFEPVWFKRHEPYAPSGVWSVNKIDVQSKEWEAFNNAFSINPDSAMKSTSIGLGQILGLHHKRLGYATVGEMWDDAKSGLERQVWQVAKFIQTDSKLLSALVSMDWHTVASIYNGSGYMAIAQKCGREPYNISLKKSYEQYV